MHRMMLVAAMAMLLAMVPVPSVAREPILDVHLHAPAADDQGPPPLAMCTPLSPMPRWDQDKPYPVALIDYFKHPLCKDPVWSPKTDDEIMTRTLAIMAKHNIIGVVSGSYRRVMAWRKQAPERVLPGLIPDDAAMADAAAMTREFGTAKKAGDVTVIGEIGAQYMGIAPNDPRLEGLWTTAEAVDLPVALHVGPGPPGAAYLPGLGYRARMSSPLLLEDVLVKHPKLRLDVMHAGFPMLDDTLALLYAHPQVYVDLGVIAYTQPRPAFYRYLQALVDAGFGDRIMFGSDQMVWPETIERAIDAIEQAPFLSEAQKRDIFYNNAARFLRLDAATIARHHAM
ncbi:amidohydrolase family protein [Sphingomonas sp. RT2P30]|uniref:amidohydrolase family protein n=1 Tax=Parasphingomonas halimpatiens TaxID=3096162 RepID=UPI002FCB1B9E